MHVTANSKEVKVGSIFFALKGAKFDGHDFINSAIEAGASKIFCEREVPHLPLPKGTTLEVIGNDARKKLGEFASAMFERPTHTLKMIGVTGTSGKTTTTYLIHHLLTSMGARCARLGTNGGFFEGKDWPTENTTPDALTLQKWFREVKDLGATHVVMEVSSHALHQDRVWGIEWDSAVFLNLSPEHMDYHPTLDAYFDAKSMLFTSHADFSITRGKSPVLWTNGDHAYGKQMSSLREEIKTYSVSTQIRSLENTATGIAGSILLGEPRYSFDCPLFGSFQVENILAAVNTVISLGFDAKAVIHALRTFPGVPGRMEFISNDRGIFVFVDYAHKPEALLKVLQSIQGKRIFTVFGCGGDRDKTKRPVMGEIATRLSHYVILTSDNPRTEDPLQILFEIEGGIKTKNYEVIPDRALAIQKAIELAEPGDVVLIAGKGHEDYQIFGLPDGRTEKRYFDDREEARKVLDSN